MRGGGGGFWVSCVGGGVEVFGIVDKTESLNFHNSFERGLTRPLYFPTIRQFSYGNKTLQQFNLLS